MKLLLRSIVVILAIASFEPVAFAQITDWSNTGPDTNFDNPLNWFTSAGTHAVPTAGASTHIFPGFTVDSGLFVIPGGSSTITINANTTDENVGELLVSSNFDPNSTTGTLNFNIPSNTLNVGAGGVVVTGAATVNYTGNLTSAGSLVVGTTSSTIDNGAVSGAGTFNLLAGTLDLSTTSLIIGQTGATGTFAQSGSGTSLLVVNQFTMTNPATKGGYTISGTGTHDFELSNNGSFQLGNGNAFDQNDTNSIVDLTATGSTTQLGLASGDAATYKLEAGILGTRNATLGFATGSTGTVTQTGGSLVTFGTFAIGGNGTGIYTLSGGGADFQNGFTVGDSIGSSITQSGSSTLQSEGAVSIGVTGTGTYALQSGTATFSNNVTVGATGTITQSGGTLDIALGSQLKMNAAGGTYNLGGGTLQVGNNGTNGILGTTGQGTLNFAGGTLQTIGAATITDGLDGTITGTSTLDTTNANLTLSGNLTGAGAFSIIGGKTVSITGTNNVGTTWGAQLSGSGTTLLAASTASLSTTGSYALGAGTTLSINSGAAATDTFAGSITGTGNLVVGANDAAAKTLVLTGNVNLTGASTTTIGAGGFGTLEVNQGTLSSLNGSAGSAANTFVVGDGVTTGTVNLLGTNTLPRATVNTGSTLFAQSITGNVTNNGTLGSNGTLTNVLNTPTLTITGNLNSTGTLDIRMNGGNADLINVTGTANLNNSTGVNIINGSGTGTYTILSSSNLQNAPTISVPGTVLFSYTITPSGNNWILNTSQNLISGFATTPNQAAVGNALDPLTQAPPPSFAPILAALNNLPANQIPIGLEELSPESLQYARNIAFENSTFLAQRVDGVLANLRGGYTGLDTSGIGFVIPGFESGTGRSLSSLLAYNSPYHPAAPNGVNYYPGGGSTDSSDANAESSVPSPHWDSSSQTITDSPDPRLSTTPPNRYKTPAFSEFISGDIVLADLNQNQSTTNAPFSKASYTAGNVTAGVSFRMASNLAMGVLFDYGHTDAKTDNHGSKTKVDTYSPGLYATYFDHGFYANGLFSFGYNDYSNSRDIGLTNSTAHSSPSGQQYVANLDFGYDFRPDPSWVVGPTLGATYTHLDVDSFTENGAGGADLSVNSQSVDSLRSRLGAHVSYLTQVGSMTLQPSFTAMWQHEYMADSSGITSQFNIPGSGAFTINTAAPSRDSALIGCGLTATINGSMSLYLNYLADVGASDYFAQSIVGGIKTRF